MSKKELASPDEHEIVANMLKNARQFSLEVEVVVAFGRYMKAGDPMDAAACAAQYDWDI